MPHLTEGQGGPKREQFPTRSTNPVTSLPLLDICQAPLNKGS